MSFFFVSMNGKMKTKTTRLEVIHMHEDIGRSKKRFPFSHYLIHRLTRSKIFFNFFLAVKIASCLLHCDVTSILTVVEFEETLSPGLRSVRATFLRNYWNPQ